MYKAYKYCSECFKVVNLNEEFNKHINLMLKFNILPAILAQQYLHWTNRTYW